MSKHPSPQRPENPEPPIIDVEIVTAFCVNCKREVCGQDLEECPVCLGTLLPTAPR